MDYSAGDEVVVVRPGLLSVLFDFLLRSPLTWTLGSARSAGLLGGAEHRRRTREWQKDGKRDSCEDAFHVQVPLQGEV
jgi:hypothetical protein